MILACVPGAGRRRPLREALAIPDGDPTIFLRSTPSTGFAMVAAVLLVLGP